MTEGKVTGANVSVKLDDAFMQAAVEGKPYVQQYPIDAANPAFSGLMMFAKDEKTQRTLRDNWHDIVTDRRYVAVVEGSMEKDYDSFACNSLS